MRRWVIAAWALAGVAFLLGRPIMRMWPLAWEVLTGPMDALRVTLIVLSLVFLAFGEGYLAFHKGFSPRFADRLARLVREPRWLQAVLAPLTCMGLVPFGREDLAVMRRSWLVVIGIVALVLGVRMLGQPWRGIILLGVVVALAIGLASTAWHSARALRSDGA